MNVAPYPFSVLSICAGVGALDLGIRIAVPGARTVCGIERESYAASTLVARMEDSSMDSFPVWDDIFTFDGSPWRGRVHCIAAGLPCQPYSVAGKQLGHADERALWPEFIRVVGEVQPWMVFIENVAPFLGYFRPVGIELSKLGFVVEEPLFVTAEEVGGSHERERLFIMAHRSVADAKGRREEPSEQRRRLSSIELESSGLALAPRGGFGSVRQSSGRDGLIGGGGKGMADAQGERRPGYAVFGGMGGADVDLSYPKVEHPESERPGEARRVYARLSERIGWASKEIRRG